MMAVILAGGIGTRLRPYTITIPKPLLPIGDYPILEIVTKQLRASGVDLIVLTLGSMYPFFKSFIGDGSRWGVSVRYSIETTPLGTAGPLRLIDDWTDDIIVMNGDLLTTLDYSLLLDTHKKLNAAATVALTNRVVNIDYGVVVSSKEGLLTEYIEKPIIPYTVSMGIYIVSPRVLKYIPPGIRFDMPDLLLKLVKDGEKVACYASECYWKDIGRFDDYEQASADFASNPSRFLP